MFDLIGLFCIGVLASICIFSVFMMLLYVTSRITKENYFKILMKQYEEEGMCVFFHYAIYGLLIFIAILLTICFFVSIGGGLLILIGVETWI